MFILKFFIDVSPGNRRQASSENRTPGGKTDPEFCFLMNFKKKMLLRKNLTLNFVNVSQQFKFFSSQKFLKRRKNFELYALLSLKKLIFIVNFSVK